MSVRPLSGTGWHGRFRVAVFLAARVRRNDYCCSAVRATRMARGEVDGQMNIRGWLALAGALGALIAFACNGQVEPNAGSTNCGAHARFFNGACALSCQKNEDCGASESCTQIDATG